MVAAPERLTASLHLTFPRGRCVPAHHAPVDRGLDGGRAVRGAIGDRLHKLKEDLLSVRSAGGGQLHHVKGGVPGLGGNGRIVVHVLEERS